MESAPGPLAARQGKTYTNPDTSDTWESVMPMNAAYLNAVRDHGQSLITHIGLVDGAGLPVAGVARQAVTWTDSADGVSRPSADLVFNTAAGDVVGGWRGYSALTAGTDYGGDDFAAVTFNNDGTFTLLAASTAINHTAA